MGCNLCAWACPYGARELDEEQGVMKKCTLCVDRIYDEQLPEEERQPACVMTCPTHARFFGDLDDPDSEVNLVVSGDCRVQAEGNGAIGRVGSIASVVKSMNPSTVQRLQPGHRALKPHSRLN